MPPGLGDGLTHTIETWKPTLEKKKKDEERKTGAVTIEGKFLLEQRQNLPKLTSLEYA